MRRYAPALVPILAVAMLAPTVALAQAELRGAPLVPPFSSAKPGKPPAPWDTVKINERKKLTEYEIVLNTEQPVLHAVADSAASALGVPVSFDIKSAPVLSWRWRVSGLIEDADNSIASKEDSPARIMLEFDGDRSKLSFGDRAASKFASNLSGRELPYATLMYVWSNTAPVGTVIPNPHAKRIQMVVASSGAAGVNKWQTLKRNVRDDYKRAFNEEPGLLKSVGVMTDTDNTGTKVEAWYGDLQFSEQ
jgi:hypothetical protein